MTCFPSVHLSVVSTLLTFPTIIVYKITKPPSYSIGGINYYHMKKIFIFLICIVLCCCSMYKNDDCYNYDIAQKETLIKLWAKTITHGTIDFLRYENGYYRLTVYTYRLDKRKNTSYCTLRRDTLYKKDDLINIGRGSNWLTSSMFKQYEDENQPYFRCFSEDFLELSNDEKIKVLNEICNKNQ